jgi:hypothetical protein
MDFHVQRLYLGAMNVGDVSPARSNVDDRRESGPRRRCGELGERIVHDGQSTPRSKL